MYISKKLTPNANEVDITIINTKTIVECKNVIGGGKDAVVQNVDLIIKKFTTESKLTKAIKETYPNHVGKINISNADNPYYNLSKQEFIKEIRGEVFNKPAGIVKRTFVDAVQELHVENGTGRFFIKNKEW